MLPQTDQAEEVNDKDRIISYVAAPADKEDKKNKLTILMWIIGFLILAYVTFEVIVKGMAIGFPQI